VIHHSGVHTGTIKGMDRYHRHEPTPKQLERLLALVQALMSRCGLRSSAVKTHQQINVLYTRCPGRHFPTKSFLASVEEVESRRRSATSR
jgi:N-acetyl-anhydromuramyl-L-alanine amidase AmpD